MANRDTRRIVFPGTHAYAQPPELLLGLPDARQARPKGCRRRWKDTIGRIYEWDYQHGTLEVYNVLGRHMGEFDPNTGQRLKPANPRRRIDP